MGLELGFSAGSRCLGLVSGVDGDARCLGVGVEKDEEPEAVPAPPVMVSRDPEAPEEELTAAPPLDEREKERGVSAGASLFGLGLGVSMSGRCVGATTAVDGEGRCLGVGLRPRDETGAAAAAASRDAAPAR